jgi:hypothetical protein
VGSSSRVCRMVARKNCRDPPAARAARSGRRPRRLGQPQRPTRVYGRRTDSLAILHPMQQRAIRNASGRSDLALLTSEGATSGRSIRGLITLA